MRGGLFCLLLCLLFCLDVELEGCLALADSVGRRSWRFGLVLNLRSLDRNVDPFLGVDLPVWPLSGLPRLPGLPGLSFEDHLFPAHHFLFPFSRNILIGQQNAAQVLLAEDLAKQDFPPLGLAQDPLLPRGQLMEPHILEVPISCRILMFASLGDKFLIVDTGDGNVAVG